MSWTIGLGRPARFRPLGNAASFGTATSGSCESAATAMNDKSTRVNKICFIFIFAKKNCCQKFSCSNSTKLKQCSSFFFLSPPKKCCQSGTIEVFLRCAIDFCDKCLSRWNELCETWRTKARWPCACATQGVKIQASLSEA